MAGKPGQGKAWIQNNQEIRSLIAEQESFTAKHNHLVGYFVDGMLAEDAYGLSGADLDVFLDDSPLIVYVVMSYDTPIHWVSETAGTYTIANPPSKTTAGHRNLCPGYRQYRESGWSRRIQPDGKRRWVRREEQ